MRVVFIGILFLLSGCSSQPKVQAVDKFKSRLVYIPAHEYHGTQVRESSNWLLGSGNGLSGNSEYKLDMDVGGLGKFFKNAIDVEEIPSTNQTDQAVNEVSGQISSKNSNSPTSGDVCSADIKENYKLGEWTLYFDTNSIEPNNLNEILPALRSFKPTEVVVSGHTDDRGNDLYNMELSKKRALAAQKKIANIWKTKNFDIRWGGECPRAVLNVDAASRALNRRVVVSAYNTPIKDAAFSGDTNQ